METSEGRLKADGRDGGMVASCVEKRGGEKTVCHHRYPGHRFLGNAWEDNGLMTPQLDHASLSASCEMPNLYTCTNQKLTHTQNKPLSIQFLLIMKYIKTHTLMYVYL